MNERFSAGPNRLIAVAFVSAAMAAGAGGLGVWAFAQQPEAAGAKAQPPAKAQDKEVVIQLSEAPEPVRTALAKITPADKVTKVIKEQHKDIMIYEIEYKADGAECSVVFSPAGDVLELEKEVKEAALPAAALAALRKAYPNAKFDEITLIQEFSYEVEFKIDGKNHEVEFNALGQIDDDDDDDDDQDDDD